MTLNDVMAVLLRYLLNLVNTCVPTHNRVDLWRNLCTSLLYFVVRTRCRGKESSRSLSHLLMSFLFCSELRTSAQRATNRLKPSRRCNSHNWARTADRPRASRKLRHTHAVNGLTWPACRWTCATVFATKIHLNTSYICVVVAKV